MVQRGCRSEIRKRQSPVGQRPVLHQMVSGPTVTSKDETGAGVHHDLVPLGAVIHGTREIEVLAHGSGGWSGRGIVHFIAGTKPLTEIILHLAWNLVFSRKLISMAWNLHPLKQLIEFFSKKIVHKMEPRTLAANVLRV